MNAPFVNVPVLSKQRVFTYAPFTVCCGSVPDIYFILNLVSENEYATLKKIGRGGGAADPRKSNNLKKINRGYISLLKSSGSEARNPMVATMTTSTMKNIADLKRSGYLLSLVRIFRMIRPLHV